MRNDFKYPVPLSSHTLEIVLVILEDFSIINKNIGMRILLTIKYLVN